jgi:hypothetical protein
MPGFARFLDWDFEFIRKLVAIRWEACATREFFLADAKDAAWRLASVHPGN